MEDRDRRGRGDVPVCGRRARADLDDRVRRRRRQVKKSMMEPRSRRARRSAFPPAHRRLASATAAVSRAAIRRMSWLSPTMIVEEKYVMDVPSGFSPNSDNLNDTIFVNGIGIKELLDFTIYNRWGEVVHKSDDISLGWDGKYKGETQFDETYVFQATVLYWNGSTETKRGYITLLR